MMKPERYTPKELSRMSLKSLAQAGRKLSPPLRFNQNHTKAERIRRILSAYSSQDVASQATAEEGDPSQEPHAHEQTSPPSGQPITRERKPAFERLCQEDDVLPLGGDAVIDGRGGAREGAGRPLGMTDEMAVYSRLPQMPHPAIQHSLEVFFKMWAARCHCSEVCLTREQAFELALPWTRAAYLAGVLDYIPAWAMVGIELVWTTWNMVSAKAALARDTALKRKEQIIETETEESKEAA